LGAIFLIWLGFRGRGWLRPGDLLLIFFIWYGVVRFALETFRVDNWTFNGVPVAQIVSLLFVVPSLLILAWRHRPGHPVDDPPTHPEVATWGARGRPIEAEPAPAGDDDVAATGPEPDEEPEPDLEPEPPTTVEADVTSEPDPASP
jgi:hypothetical protein